MSIVHLCRCGHRNTSHPIPEDRGPRGACLVCDCAAFELAAPSTAEPPQPALFTRDIEGIYHPYEANQ